MTHSVFFAAAAVIRARCLSLRAKLRCWFAVLPPSRFRASGGFPGRRAFFNRASANLLLSSVLLLEDAGRSGSECFSALEPLVEYIEYRPLRYAARIENRLVFAAPKP